MKRLTTSRTYKKSLPNTARNNLFLNSSLSLAVLAVIGAVIWFGGPHLVYAGYAPLLSQEKRFYAIVFCCLAWLLKFLLVDLQFSYLWRNEDPLVSAHTNRMLNRFRGVMQFMKTTNVNHLGKKLPLQDLPWFILIGPEKSGKTTLLANSRIPYILQRNLNQAAPESIKASEDCDWWITRHAGIIDVPSKYVFDGIDTDMEPGIRHQLWKFFLALLKQHGGKKNISGIAIALPFPELMKQHDEKALRMLAVALSRRINDMQTTLQKQLPCYLVITKCDQLSGFNEFFTEISDEETRQAWGIMLPRVKKTDDVGDLFSSRFNALIKKLNQQLISRLHQERNPMARPYIKNFPLQVEKLKVFTTNFIKQMNEGPAHPRLQGVYLTSSLQVNSEPDTTIAGNELNQSEHALQIFKESGSKSRSYFITQFISDGLLATENNFAAATGHSLKLYAVYSASAAAIIAAGFILGSDFRLGILKTHHVQAQLSSYQNALQQFHNPEDSMIKTLALLDGLRQAKDANESKTIFSKIMTYYSDKSQRNAARVYYHALQAFFMPEVRSYLADYLDNPINKDAESIYSVLKAYLMLGDAAHYDGAYLHATMANIMPKTFSKSRELLYYLDAALQNYHPIALDKDVISGTRKYLLSLRGSQLGYIILKSMNGNTQKSDALLGDNVKTNALFTSKHASTAIPSMFTGKHFVNIFEQEIQISAVEAATGNWILGTDFNLNTNPNYTTEVAQELRTDYVKNYADAWETLLSNIQIDTPRDLSQADAIITSMISYDSPLLRILNNIHENTFFEPVTTASPKLYSIGLLIDKSNQAKRELYELLTCLDALHEYLKPVLSAEDPKRAAYQLITERMQHQGALDPISRVRLAADQSPMPVKGWINQLTNDIWHFLLKDGMHYLDTSWSEKVTSHYQNQIANRYPFNNKAVDEVSYQKFVHFFGKPGTIISFYNTYLMPLIDTSKPEWTWKKLGAEELPLAPEGARQIQLAMKIHHAFFPNDDDILYVPFALQQQNIGKNIKTVKLNMNNRVIVDKRGKNSNPHVLAWPHDTETRFSSVELTLADNKPVQLQFPGPWGWFRLVNQTYESARSKNEIILNFSRDKTPAQYILSAQGKNNPFIGLNLSQFDLPGHLTTITS